MFSCVAPLSSELSDVLSLGSVSDLAAGLSGSATAYVGLYSESAAQSSRLSEALSTASAFLSSAGPSFGTALFLSTLEFLVAFPFDLCQTLLLLLVRPVGSGGMIHSTSVSATNTPFSVE